MKINFILFFLLGVCVSCQEEDQLLKDTTNLTSKNERPILQKSIRSLDLDSVFVNNEGALVFATPSVYYRIVDTLLTCSNEELNCWEESIGFNSLRKTINNIYEEVYKENDIDKFPVYAEKYSNFVHIKNGNLVPIVEASFYRNILNNNNFFYIGNDKYQVDDKNVIISHNENSKMKTSSNNEKISFNYYEEVISDRSQLKSAGSYPPGVTSDFTVNEIEGSRFGQIDNYTYQFAPYNVSAALQTTYKLYRTITQKNNDIWFVKYYLEINIWSWAIINNKWSYYIPSLNSLYFKELSCTLKRNLEDVTSQLGSLTNSNSLNSQGSYHLNVTLMISNMFVMVRGEYEPKIRIESISYKFGCEPSKLWLSCYYGTSAPR